VAAAAAPSCIRLIGVHAPPEPLTSPEPKSLQRSTDRVVVDGHDAGEALDAAVAPHRLESFDYAATAPSISANMASKAQTPLFRGGEQGRL